MCVSLKCMYKHVFKRLIDFILVFLVLAIIWPMLFLITLWLHFANKGAGAFFTMQNLIRFHGCTAVNDKGRRLDKYHSLAFLSSKSEAYKNGGGWHLLAVLKKMLDDNNIDIEKKMAEWRKK